MKFRRSIATQRSAYTSATHMQPWMFRHPWLTLSSVGIFIVGALYVIYGLPSWRIAKLEVRGQYTLPLGDLRTVTVNQMHARWLGFFHQNSLWAFDTHAYERRLQERWIFTTIHIAKKPAHRIVLTIEEEQPAFTLSFSGQVYGVNRKGVISNILTSQSTSIPQLALDATPVSLGLGTEVLSPDDTAFLQNFIAQVRDRHDSTLNIVGVQVAASPDPTVHVFMQGDWSIIIDRTASLADQAQAFFTAYDQKLRGKKVQYVDVTVPARVYYK